VYKRQPVSCKAKVPKPSASLAAGAVIAPVPPLLTGIVEAPHTPELIVPTVSILEVPAQVLNVVFSTLSIPQRALTAAVVVPPVPPDARARGVAKELIVPLVIKILSASILD
jgi:hypothetical protein